MSLQDDPEDDDCADCCRNVIELWKNMVRQGWVRQVLARVKKCLVVAGVGSPGCLCNHLMLDESQVHHSLESQDSPAT